jgi:hypothetical protein
LGVYKKTADTAEAVASGKVNIKTVAQEATEAAEHSVEHCASQGAACAKRVFSSVLMTHVTSDSRSLTL